MGRLWVFRVFVFEKSDISAVVKNVSGSKKKKKSLKVPYDYWPWKWVIWYCINMFSAGRKVMKLVQNFERNHVFSCLELVSLYEGKNQCGCSRQLNILILFERVCFCCKNNIRSIFCPFAGFCSEWPLVCRLQGCDGIQLKT